MIIVIGEILIDRFPEYERIGGAPFNFAFHLKNMDYPVRFITRIGDDENGLKIRQMMASHGFDTNDVQIDHRHPTGRVDVTLDNKGIPHFHICENVAYDHISLSDMPHPQGAAVDMIYFGTLIQRTDFGCGQVQQYLKKLSAKTTVFCDINFRAPHINRDAVEPSLYHADILKINDEELENILSICKGPSSSSDAIDWLMQKYGIFTIALTHGAKGSTVFQDGTKTHNPAQTVTQLMDTVGAGDAFASVLAAGTLKQLSMKHTLAMATSFAARICELPGAVPKNKQVYAHLKNDFERIPNAQ